MMTGRSAALQALFIVRKHGGFAGDALEKSCAGLDARESALAYHLCLGTLQNRLYLDWCIGKYTALSRLEPRILDILRLGAYQLLFSDKIPAQAAVDESVKMAKRYSPRASGLVNAVLRKIGTEKPEPPESRLLYSLPEWLFQRLKSTIGESEALEFGKAANTVPPVYVHADKPPEGFAKHEWLEGCYFRFSAAGVDGLLVADPGAKLAALALDAKPGERIWDACAAPGGKSFLMARMMENRGYILSTDKDAKKIAEMRESAERLGISAVDAQTADASCFEPSGEGFDAVLCDVPCSGFGVLRKKPDIRFKNPAEFARLPEVQLAILRNAAKCVRPGGRIVYVTCTIFPEENERVTEAFLAENKAFAAEGFSLPEPVGRAPGGAVTLWPHRFGTDGFYICRMRRSD